MRFKSLTLMLVVAGCTTTDEPVSAPSGATIQQAKCMGSPNACMNQAAKKCGGSYQVADSSSNAGGLLADIIPGPVVWYKLSYMCGKSDGRMPAFQFRGPQYIPAPVQAPRSRRTTCNAIGNSVYCDSY
jgi:hypothetical protein